MEGLADSSLGLASHAAWSPMAHDDPYLTFLRERTGRVFYVKPYQGNAGDTLIRMGTVALLSRMGLATTVDPRNANVILWPGGNPTMWESNVCGWREAFAKYPHAEFVVGPATFWGAMTGWRETIVRNLARIGGLFARDVPSYDNLKSLGISGRVLIGLSHDPALCLNRTDWIRQHRTAARNEYILISLRSDHEAFRRPGLWWRIACLLVPGWARYSWDRFWSLALARQQANRIRRALPGGSPVVVRDAARDTVDVFVETVRDAAEVHTDRLHVMLLAVMLGKPVIAYQTLYGKLEAVYEHSLKGMTGVNVTFRRFP